MIILEDLNGRVCDVEGLIPLSLYVDSLQPQHDFESVEGRDGDIDFDTVYMPRILIGRYGFKANEYKDYYSLQTSIYKLFAPKKRFYIKREDEPYKRWKVKVESSFRPERHALTLGEFEVPFKTIGLPFAESINIVEYKHSANFSFNNIGDVPIDMREQTETEIVFQGASEGLIIRNKTTGDEWSYKGSTTDEDIILLKGVRSTKNGQSIFRDTNKKLLTFAPGWNDIEIEGSTDYTITIKTRFYYI